MNSNILNEYIAHKFLSYDKLCFEKCILTPEKGYSQQEKNCFGKINQGDLFFRNMFEKVDKKPE